MTLLFLRRAAASLSPLGCTSGVFLGGRLPAFTGVADWTDQGNVVNRAEVVIFHAPVDHISRRKKVAGGFVTKMGDFCHNSVTTRTGKAKSEIRHIHSDHAGRVGVIAVTHKKFNNMQSNFIPQGWFVSNLSSYGAK